MKQYMNVIRIVGSIMIFLLFFTGTVQAQFQNERYNSNGSKPLDITMISSMVMQPAWLTNTTNSMSNVDVVRPITTAEQLAASDALFKNNTIGSTRGLGRDEACALALAPAEAKNGSEFNAGFVYVDCDDNNTTFQSSVALLDLGTNTCTQIERAFLYWTAYDPDGNGAKDENSRITYVTPYKGLPTMKSYSGDGAVGNGDNQNTCLFMPAGAASYTPITADALVGEANGSKTYVADVTSQIVQTGETNGLYWVANVKSGVNGASIAAGWSLVVIYSSSATPPRSILLLDGNITVSGDVQIPIDLGNNKPASDNAVSYVGYIGTDGEAYASAIGCNNANGNTFSVGSNNGSPVTVQQFTDQPPVSYTTHNSGNCGIPTCTEGYDGVLSHTLTAYSRDNDKNGNPISRIPDTRYTVGYDAHHVKLPAGAVQQDATTVTFTLPKDFTGDYQARMAYLAIETLEPVLTIDKAVIPGLSSDLNSIDPSMLENTEITYRIGVTNKTSADLDGGTFNSTATITDPLPVGLDLIDAGKQPVGVSGVPNIQYYYYRVESNGTQTPIIKTDPAICWRYALDPVTQQYTVIVENNEPLGANEGVYVDIYTRLKPYNHDVWAESCNRVIKNVATLNFGGSHNPSSDACNPNADIDASATIDNNWDTNQRTLINVQIETGNSLVNDINADSRLAALGGGFTIYRCTSIDTDGDCFGNIDGLTPLAANETYDGMPNQLFIAYKAVGTLELGENSWICYRDFIVRPVPLSPAFKVETTKATVSCAANQGTNNDGSARALVDTKQQNIAFNYELRDMNGNAIVGTSGSKTNFNSNEFIEISSFATLAAGTYYVYISGLNYDNIPASVERNGYIAADGTLQPILTSTANPPSTLIITDPQALSTPSITANSQERCINNGDIINLTAAATGAGTIGYVWNTADGVSGTGNNTLSQTPAQRGDVTYSVFAQNENGCKSDTGIIAIKVGDVPEFGIGGLDRTFCSNEGTALASITPADPNVSYNWTSTIHGQNQGTSWTLPTTGDADITVTGTDNSYNFCTRMMPTMQFNIEQQVVISGFTVMEDGAPINPGATSFDIGDVVTITVNATGDTPNLNYAWTIDGAAYGGNNATIQITLLKSTNFSVNVSNLGGVQGCDAVDRGRLEVCQAKFTMTPASEIKRCSNNSDPLLFTAVLDSNSSTIADNGFILRLYNDENLLLYEERNSLGRFEIQPAQLTENVKRAEITAIPQCDLVNTTRWAVQSVNITIYPEVQIHSLLANGINTDATAVQLGEAIKLEVNPWEADRHLYIINNDIWTLGNVYIDYPVNDKIYEVVLTDNYRVCSDTRLVNVTVKPLPNAVLSSENANFEQYVSNNSIANKPVWISVIGKWQVYNRYGQEEFSASSPDDSTPVVWAGQDKQEKQLPPGTYFYIYTTPRSDVKRGTVEVVK